LSRPLRHGACWFARHGTCRALVRRPPFSPGRGAMSFDVRAVDRREPVNAAMPGQRLENGKPPALAAPAIEAVVDGRVRPVGHRTVAPARPGTQHMHDPADYPTIIDPMRAARRPRGSNGSIRAHSASLSHVMPFITSSPD